MRGLIGDLLDTERIESGTLSVAPEPSEVAVLVERARESFLGGGGRHAVLVALSAGLPPVMADRRRVVQVLNNLLANAARHAPEATPIRVGAAAEEAHVAVSGSDEGRGVVPERLLRLFSRNARGGQGATAGQGLGLAICRGLVEAHGGRIRAASAGAGRGTTVTFTIPAARRTRWRGGRLRRPSAAGPGTERTAARPGGRRRPPDAALRPRRSPPVPRQSARLAVPLRRRKRDASRRLASHGDITVCNL